MIRKFLKLTVVQLLVVLKSCLLMISPFSRSRIHGMASRLSFIYANHPSDRFALPYSCQNSLLRTTYFSAHSLYLNLPVIVSYQSHFIGFQTLMLPTNQTVLKLQISHLCKLKKNRISDFPLKNSIIRHLFLSPVVFFL